MLRVTPRKGNRKRKPARRVIFRDISACADALGCSRGHLWQVLTGRRQSKSLLARYHQLTKSN